MPEVFKIGIVGNYYGRPFDILLPIINENELSEKHNNSGHCFHIYSIDNTELLIFSYSHINTKRTAKIDIRSVCLPNSDISLMIVKTSTGTLLLRAYIDETHNALFPLPDDLQY